jgi:phosphohistidine swiveling domain-containing protein
MTKPKYLYHDQDPWMLAEDIPDLDFVFSEVWLSAFVNDLAKTVGRNYKKIICVYHGCNLKFYYGEKDSDDFAKHVLGLIINKPSFGRKINLEIRFFSIKLKNFVARFNGEELVRLTNKNLADLYLELDALHTELYTWGWLPNAVDMFHGNFTNYLKDKLAAKVAPDQVNSVLVAMSTAQEGSVIDQEQDSFLKLVSAKQAGREAEFSKLLEEHTRKYFFTKHLWLGKEGVYDRAYYLKEVKKFISSGQSARAVLREKAAKQRADLNKRRALVKKLKINGKLLQLFDIYAEFSVTKAFRRDAQLLWAYKMDLVFDELRRRLRLSLASVRFMFPKEIAQALKKGLADKTLTKSLKIRSKSSAYYAEKNIDVIFTGSEVKKIEKMLFSEVAQNIQELSGQAACLGKAKGLVRIINSVADMAKMNKGDILVSIATNPDIVPAMKKAAAIVTEQGGITSHAAIVSREFNTPCIIGTKIATKVLHDGDLVEVDANQGIVKIIKR